MRSVVSYVTAPVTKVARSLIDIITNVCNFGENSLSKTSYKRKTNTIRRTNFFHQHSYIARNASYIARNAFSEKQRHASHSFSHTKSFRNLHAPKLFYV